MASPTVILLVQVTRFASGWATWAARQRLLRDCLEESHGPSGKPHSRAVTERHNLRASARLDGVRFIFGAIIFLRQIALFETQILREPRLKSRVFQSTEYELIALFRDDKLRGPH